MTKSTREHLTEGSVWLRALFMLLFTIVLGISEIIIAAVVLYQLISVLFTGKVNATLLQLGKNLAVYAREIFEYLTFNSETRPFPFSTWPDEAAGGEQWLKEDEDAAASANAVSTDAASANANATTTTENKDDTRDGGSGI